jgi:trehalose/maltose transport system substrate-binding protein
MGGSNLSIFRGTKHPPEAKALVRFLCRRDVQKARAVATSQPPTFVDLYDDAEVLKANPHFAELKNLLLHNLAMRPSGVAGDKYTEVSVAYFQAVHDVLTHKMDPSQAGEKLQADLVHITGFPVAGTTGK